MANSEQPDVAVIVPTRDRRHLLPRALDSVFAQTHANFELIVVDLAAKIGPGNPGLLIVWALFNQSAKRMTRQVRVLHKLAAKISHTPPGWWPILGHAAHHSVKL